MLGDEFCCWSTTPPVRCAFGDPIHGVRFLSLLALLCLQRAHQHRILWLSIHRCDVGAAEESAAAAGFAAGGGASIGLVHAAGVLADATLANQTAGHVRSVFAPKVAGADGLLQVRSFETSFVTISDTD